MDARNYHRATSLDDALSVLQKNSSNVLVAGGAWIKMSVRSADTIVDISNLNLNQIEETKTHISIGAMTTLHGVETHPSIAEIGDGFLVTAIKQIMGVGFRNIATIGGSIMGRYAFSDVITPLLSLDAILHFHPKNEISLASFLTTPRTKNDLILTHIIIKKELGKGYFKKISNTPLSFSLLNIAIYKTNKTWQIAVGSRPSIAMICQEAGKYLSEANNIDEKDLQIATSLAMESLSFGDNNQASSQYRHHLAQVYILRGLKEVSSR
jgi:CO/xanthine dehydrogenase FAD-binding subunit